ncbi:MAG: hypothetical protein PHW04_12655 [Candidatus Wallbacteria bacterium]|nr:hypothetical protein [Candidatus Wallbacteria bacterium]
MENILLSPPLAFLIVLGSSILLFLFLAGLAFSRKNKAPGEGKAYACGEEAPDQLIQPDYSKVFKFAYFFTILHVTTLMITTIPAETMGSLAIAVTYLLVMAVGLSQLMKS